MLDATTGQNGLTQARIFAEVVDVTGIVLTKLDGSAKGGIVVQVQRELGVPVKLVGLGRARTTWRPSIRRCSWMRCSSRRRSVDGHGGAEVLGKTERPVSVVGLGTWQLGGNWGEVSETAALWRCWTRRSRRASRSSTRLTSTATAAASS